MTAILQLLPERRLSAANEIINAAHKVLTKPLALDHAKNFCAQLSEKLLNDPRTKLHPELQALGFWLRPASVEKMLAEYGGGQTSGIVFQIPPANVDALFGYTLVISLLCGNATIIRLPSAERPAQELLVTILSEILSQVSAALRERITLLRYDHDDKITSQFSMACDVRLVWGSDATIEHIGLLPLPPHAREISFGDRFSTAAFKSAAYLKMSEPLREELVKKFFNDVYLFDQLACSSPRLLAWIGDSSEASADFYPRLAAYAVQRDYNPGPGGNIAKLNMTFLALHDLAPAVYKTYGPLLSVLTLKDLPSLASFKTVNYGYGMLMETSLTYLAELAKHAEPCDQTLAHWGFDEAEIKQFTAQCRGRGYSRIVPVGQALNFDAVWEGINLFEAMTVRKQAAA